MNVTSLRRWHWTLIGLLAGALYGYVRESSANFYDELTSFNARRIGQREFEAAVTSDFHGKRRFSDLVVRPYRLAASGGPTITVHVVSGLYFDGRTQVENGRVAAHWEPAYFVASAPYFPNAAPARTPAATSPASATPAQIDNVMSYLRAPPGNKPIPFEYASWWWATRPQILWTCVGVFVIGGIWPTLVNLLAFGALTRPAEAKGLSLWRATPTPSDTSPESTTLDPAALEALDRGLADAAAAPPEPAPSAPSQPAIRALRGAAETEAAAAAAAQEQKDFGKADEDFYPTEIHARHET
jgi:hypothetical protein